MLGAGRASPTWRLSLTYSPALLWAGGCHRQWKQRSFWTRWNRRCGPVDRPAPSITAIKAISMCRWRTCNGFRMQGCWHQRAVQGDSYDNALAESINGLYKAEVIHRKSWKNRSEVELATLAWVDWYYNRRLLGRLGHIPPVEAEKAYYASIGNGAMAA